MSLAIWVKKMPMRPPKKSVKKSACPRCVRFFDRFFDVCPFLQVAPMTCRNHIVPLGSTAPAFGNHVIDGQLFRTENFEAILTSETVPEVYVTAGEIDFACMGTVTSHHYDAGHGHCQML